VDFGVYSLNDSSAGVGVAAEWPLSAVDGSNIGFSSPSTPSLQTTNPSKLLHAVDRANGMEPLQTMCSLYSKCACCCQQGYAGRKSLLQKFLIFS